MTKEERKTLLLQIAAIILCLILFSYVFLNSFFEDMERLETTDVTYSNHEAAVKVGELKRGY